ncbi:TetR/AcrR family transcriptional regulator [Solimonas sp. K1W22B-7]|uniref:TetR/AcrR family transcriptional regulator n=1 Tax=Solimonas sp. K1W22B-7 TaxID=2303331 RepID=UPI000E333FBF|nr:TetR/AcrR family transcriptional regulator [Solimonas sp. K1W22B-7]AXQ30676.1 TetR/AcrR family transcriptional regulator [Solimonas sp. K1W22B-7]
MRQPPKAGKTTVKKAGKAASPRRQYDSPLRRQQAAETRERIIAAGAEIAHRLPAWDWSQMTFKAVGELAGVSERTVHRYIATERQLRDAVLQRLFQESGISLDGLTLGDFAGIATRAYRYISSFTVSHYPVTDPTFAAMDQHRRAALIGAVVQSTPGWSQEQREIVASMLDMFWHPALNERLTTSWQFDADRASQAMTWMIGLINKAIQQGHKP